MYHILDKKISQNYRGSNSVTPGSSNSICTYFCSNHHHHHLFRPGHKSLADISFLFLVQLTPGFTSSLILIHIDQSPCSPWPPSLPYTKGSNSGIFFISSSYFAFSSLCLVACPADSKHFFQAVVKESLISFCAGL